MVYIQQALNVMIYHQIGRKWRYLRDLQITDYQ